MMPAPLVAWVEGIGFLAPGLADWPAARAVLRGEQHYRPAPSLLPHPVLLPPAERRRASRIVRLTLAIGLEAAAHGEADVGALATVFASSGADGYNCHALCEQLATDDRQISPTRFHNSVHNAAAGYWGIATGSMAQCQVLCAYDASFGAGLLDALGQVLVDGQRTLLIAYDSEYPEPLYSKRRISDCGGVALLLAPARSQRALGRIAVTATARPAQALADAGLDSLRQDIPAMRGLPLLASLARGEPEQVTIEYLPPMQFSIAVEPC
jgi:hypothetical protein